MKNKKDIEEERNLKNETVWTSGNKEMLKRLSIVGGIAIVSFLLGFLPVWLSARGYENERNAAVKTLRPSVLQNNLATATINTRRGEFEQARQQMSDFFTDLRIEFDLDETAFSPQHRESIQQILAQRDEIITLLARNDSAAVDRLTNIYFAFIEAKTPSAAKN